MAFSSILCVLGAWWQILKLTVCKLISLKSDFFFYLLAFQEECSSSHVQLNRLGMFYLKKCLATGPAFIYLFNPMKC